MLSHLTQCNVLPAFTSAWPLHHPHLLRFEFFVLCPGLRSSSKASVLKHFMVGPRSVIDEDDNLVEAEI